MKIIFVGGIVSGHKSDIKELRPLIKVTARCGEIILSGLDESVAYGEDVSELYVLKNYIFVGSDQQTHEYGFYMSPTSKQSDLAMAIQHISWEVQGYV